MKKVIGIFLAIASLRILGHEGHGIPGALPPAPHGGVVQGAEHKTNTYSDKQETELFFEVVYRDKEITIYPLFLPTGIASSFVVLPARKQLSDVTLNVELPRENTAKRLKPVVTDHGIKALFDSKEANRFIVHVMAKHANEQKVAQIQIEKH